MADGALALPVPIWHRYWPRRYVWELDQLRQAGIDFEVDAGLLAQGTLVIRLSRPSRGRSLKLEAVFPDSYPWLPPHVNLLGPSSQYPERHCSPLDGKLCLIGRDTRQWRPEWSLRELLDHQLDDAIADTGEEDPQGEPAEFWWNTLPGDDESFVLVDSAWNPGDCDGGHLEVRCRLDHGLPNPVLRACVMGVVGAGGESLATFDWRPPRFSQQIRVPWINLDQTLVPGRSGVDVGAQLWALVRDHSRFREAGPQQLGRHQHQRGKLLAVSYPMEVGFRKNGAGWLFLLSMGKNPMSSQKPGAALRPIRTFRAGLGDLMVRNPQARALAGKRVTVVGAGAIGGLIPLELAKNGCAHLTVVEHDISDPGISVRSVVGFVGWGANKAANLKTLIDQHWPTCDVAVRKHMIGSPTGDRNLSEEVLRHSHLVIDASASYAVTQWLGEECGRSGVPFVALMAYPEAGGVGGGLVAIFSPSGGCPRCLEHADHLGHVPSFGDRLVEPDLQPPGCSERTFEGSSYDLQELSLQAVRMAVAALSRVDASFVATLRFEESEAGMRLPRWELHPFRVYEECECRLRRS